MKRGTTPTVAFSFHVVDPHDIAVAYLTISQRDKILIEREIDTATVGNNTLSWDLTQLETLKLEKGKAVIECRYRAVSGKAYATETKYEDVEDVQKDGVI